jgi:hypothetical protein
MAGPPVQQVYVGDGGDDTCEPVLAAPPTPGNTLIAAMYVREGSLSTQSAPVGWSLAGRAVCSLPDNWALAVWTKPVLVGDPAALGTFRLTPLSLPGGPSLYVAESAGLLAAVGDVAVQSGITVALASRTLTPPAGRASVLWAFAACRNDSSPTWLPAGCTEVLDTDAFGTSNGPRCFAGYVVVNPTTGAGVAVGATSTAAGSDKAIVAVELRDAAPLAVVGEPGGGYW